MGLAVGVTAAVVLACAGGAYLYSKHHMRSLLETARATALAEGELIRVALEHQMIENDRTLIAKMIESFRKQAAWSGWCCWTGRARSGTRAAGDHERGPSDRIADVPSVPPVSAGAEGDSRVIERAAGGAAHGGADPQPAECFGCHDPRHKINGILILDYRTSGIERGDGARPSAGWWRGRRGSRCCWWARSRW